MLSPHRYHKYCSLLLLLILGFSCVSAQELSLTGKTDKRSPFYEPGEAMIFRITLEQGRQPVSGKRLRWSRTGDDGITDSGEAISSTEPLVITTSTNQPGFVRIRVAMLDDNGNEFTDQNQHKVIFDGGAGVRPEALQGVAEPADFDAYWQRQKQRLAAVPLQVLESVQLPNQIDGIDTYDIKITCAGNAPVSGYYSKPANAANGSCAAKLNFHGYGIRSSNRNDEQAATAGKPMIVLNINAHGIKNGQPQEYYTELANGRLKNYAFNREENAAPESAYYNGMALRVLRALEFLKSQPEWDGKTLIVEGGSQGALQALWAAGLDADVTQLLANKPWACDLGGGTLGRLTGWRPEYTPALDYFDPIHHARRIRAQTRITSGLGDYVCPPSGLAVLYNNIPAGIPKRIEYLQGATHGNNPPRMARYAIESK